MAISTDDLIALRSVEVLKQGQAESGAFVASPSFPTYRYAWLRDGAFCAYALDQVGEAGSSAAFHGWAARSIEAHRPMIESAIDQVAAGETPPPEQMPPARYTLEGSLEQPDDEPWPNFQVDGYGMWLWALREHLAAGAASSELGETVELVARYIAMCWQLKSFSCWEEFDSGEHASSLGATIAGLDAAALLLDDPAWRSEADRVRSALFERFVEDGRFTRGPGDARLDGSLLWLSIPFDVLPPDDSRIERTVDGIRRELLRPTGGVYRYRGDTYYGGGEWILLTCSLAWHEARIGESKRVVPLRDWVRSTARPNGDLPEQVADHAQEPAMVAPWVARWGPSATPLLWSHAMYLVMEEASRA
jgi:GH15 family glucan-1,4-alpha-glucosidase